MSDTYQFNLPLLDAAQAQKHVTMNEALARLDAAAQLRLVSTTETVPPVGVADGTAYAVATGGVNDWDGHDGDIAVFANGGWVFMTPKSGWRAWVESDADFALFDGFSWHTSALGFSPRSGVTRQHMVDFEHTFTPGSFNQTSVLIPDSMLVFGVTARVRYNMSGGGITGWKIGVTGDAARYGTGYGLQKNDIAIGMGGTPQTYWGGTALRLTAIGSNFTVGRARLVVHGIKIAAARAY
jgi:hypothetical protein